MCSFDESVWTLSSGNEALYEVSLASLLHPRRLSLWIIKTHVKPLTSLNSFTILPPWSVTCFFALSSVNVSHYSWLTMASFQQNVRVELVGAGALLEGDLDSVSGC